LLNAAAAFGAAGAADKCAQVLMLFVDDAVRCAKAHVGSALAPCASLSIIAAGDCHGH
jgi:hypothetical protein